MDLHYRVRFLEGFKDGNILDESVPAGAIRILDKNTYERVKQSGAVIETIETLIPNPLKNKDEMPDLAEPVEVNQPVVGVEPGEEFQERYERYAVEDGAKVNPDTVLVKKRKAGRPKGSKNSKEAKG